MKIGILTFHRSINYGAYMQCLSLSHEVQKRFPSATVEVINYSSLKMEKNYKVKFNKHMVKHPLEYPYRKARIKVFVAAQQYLPLSDCTILEDTCDNAFKYMREHYDVVVVGSDAVFNWIKRGFPNPYLLDMGEDEGNPIRLSYAASAFGMGMEHVTEERRDAFGKSLERFKFIGVRDDYTMSLVKHCYSDASPTFTCDPTAFLDIDYIYELLGHTKDSFRDYFFKKYKLNPNKRIIGIMGTNVGLVRALKEKYGATHSIVAVFSATGAEDKYLYDIPPLEWALFFGLCDITLTNFFHGTLFSIRNGTPVISLDTTKFGADYKGKMQDVQERMYMDDCFFNMQKAKADGWKKVMAQVEYLLTKPDIRDLIDNNRKVLCASSEKFFGALGGIIGETNNEVYPNTIEPIVRDVIKEIRNPSTLATDHDICTGCGLCVAKCPSGAISLVTHRGFSETKVDADKCIHCGLCNKVCPVVKPKVATDPSGVWALRDKDEDQLISSASGGAFGLLAKSIIADGGSVCGVAYEDMHPKQVIVHSLEELDKLHGSKYVQAEMGDIFSEIENELKDQKKVLASGTPCQIAAIKSYFGDKYDNLYLVDLICHGVQSPSIFDGYIKEIEKAKGKKVVDFKFRDKTNGWKMSNVKIIYDDGSFDIMTRAECRYFDFFNYLRRSCYACHFRGFNNASDITIGDYWGIESLTDQFNDDKGVSIALVHTDKGRELVDALGDSAILVESNLEHALKTHAKLKSSIPIPPPRGAVLRSLEAGGFKEATSCYNSKTRLYRIKKKIKKIIKRGKSNG